MEKDLVLASQPARIFPLNRCTYKGWRSRVYLVIRWRERAGSWDRGAEEGGGTVRAGENVIMKRRSTGGDKAPRA